MPFSSEYSKTKRVLFWLLFAILVFFAGFRWDVGIDWFNYMELFDLENGVGFDSDWMEGGNVWLSSLLYLCGFIDAGYYLWVAAFITLFFIFWSIKEYSPAPILSAILLVCLGTYFDLLNGVRQYIAISIIVFSWQFIFKKQLTRYILAVILAGLFHASAFIMLPVYFIYKLRFNKNWLIILALLAFVLSFFIGPFVVQIAQYAGRYEFYSQSDFALALNPLSMLRVIFPFSILVIISWNYNKLSQNLMERVMTNLAVVSIFITLLFPGVTLMIRVGFYFSLSFIFVIPMLCKYFSKTNASLLKWYSIIYGIVYVYITQLSRPISNIIPFELNFRLADFRLLLLLAVTFVAMMLLISLFGLRSQKNYIKKTASKQIQNYG